MTFALPSSTLLPGPTKPLRLALSNDLLGLIWNPQAPSLARPHCEPFDLAKSQIGWQPTRRNDRSIFCDLAGNFPFVGYRRCG